MFIGEMSAPSGSAQLVPLGENGATTESLKGSRRLTLLPLEHHAHALFDGMAESGDGHRALQDERRRHRVQGACTETWGCRPSFEARGGAGERCHRGQLSTSTNRLARNPTRSTFLENADCF